jgi:hypothetical protein
MPAFAGLDPMHTYGNALMDFKPEANSNATQNGP